MGKKKGKKKPAGQPQSLDQFLGPGRLQAQSSLPSGPRARDEFPSGPGGFDRNRGRFQEREESNEADMADQWRRTGPVPSGPSGGPGGPGRSFGGFGQSEAPAGPSEADTADSWRGAARSGPSPFGGPSHGGGGGPPGERGGGGFGSERREEDDRLLQQAESADTWRRAGPAPAEPFRPRALDRPSSRPPFARPAVPTVADEESNWRSRGSSGGGGGGGGLFGPSGGGSGTGGGGFNRFGPSRESRDPVDSISSWRGSGSGGGGSGSDQPSSSSRFGGASGATGGGGLGSGGTYRPPGARFGGTSSVAAPGGGRTASPAPATDGWRPKSAQQAPSSGGPVRATQPAQQTKPLASGSSAPSASQAPATASPSTSSLSTPPAASAAAWTPKRLQQPSKPQAQPVQATGESQPAQTGTQPQHQPASQPAQASQPQVSPPLAAGWKPKRQLRTAATATSSTSPEASKPPSSTPPSSSGPATASAASLGAAAPGAGAWKPRAKVARPAASASPAPSSAVPASGGGPSTRPGPLRSGSGGKYQPPSARMGASSARPNGVSSSLPPTSRGWEASNPPRRTFSPAPAASRPAPSTSSGPSRKPVSRTPAGETDIFGNPIGSKPKGITTARPASTRSAAPGHSMQQQLNAKQSARKVEQKKKEEELTAKIAFEKALESEEAVFKVDEWKAGIKNIDLDKQREQLVTLTVRCWHEGTLNIKQIATGFSKEFEKECAPLLTEVLVAAKEKMGEENLSTKVRNFQKKMNLFKFLEIEETSAPAWFDERGLSCLKPRENIGALITAQFSELSAAEILDLIQAKRGDRKRFENAIAKALAVGVFEKYFSLREGSQDEAESYLKQYREVMSYVSKDCPSAEIEYLRSAARIWGGKDESAKGRNPTSQAEDFLSEVFETLFYSRLASLESFQAWRLDKAPKDQKAAKAKALMATNQVFIDIENRLHEEELEAEEEEEEEAMIDGDRNYGAAQTEDGIWVPGDLSRNQNYDD